MSLLTRYPSVSLCVCGGVSQCICHRVCIIVYFSVSGDVRWCPCFPPSFHSHPFPDCAAPCKAPSLTMTRSLQATRPSPAGSHSTWSTTRECYLSCTWPTRLGASSTMTAPMLCWSTPVCRQARTPRATWSDFVASYMEQYRHHSHAQDIWLLQRLTAPKLFFNMKTCWAPHLEISPNGVSEWWLYGAILGFQADSLPLVICDTEWVTVALHSAFFSIHWSGYSAVWLLLGRCHVKLLLSHCMFCLHHTAMHQFTVSLYLKLHTEGPCVFSCNLPHALLAGWLGPFTCNCGNTGVERIPK